MLRFESIPRRVLLAIALVFAAITTFYTLVWMYYISRPAPISIGIEWKLEYAPYVTVEKVIPNGPADKAGVRPGDKILRVNGYPQHVMSMAPALARGRHGDVVTLEVERSGQGKPLQLQMVLGPAHTRERLTLAKWLAVQEISYYPVPFLVVGMSVLFLRLEDRNAWLLAVLFAGFIAAAPVAQLEGVLSPVMRRFMLTYMLVLYALTPAIFYWFFATFPVPSPIDRRLPNLKYIMATLALAGVLPFALVALVTGSSYSALRLTSLLSERIWVPISSIYPYGAFGLGLVSLILNRLNAPTANDRRKIQAMLWGTAASMLPFMITGLIALAH